MDQLPFGALLGVLAVLLILSAFFSIAETSMMAINRYRLKHLVQQGNRGARLTSELLAKTDKLLGVILLGNILLNAAAATLTVVVTRRLFGEGEIALGLGTLAITFATLIISEITPKVVGAAYPEIIAPLVAYLLSPLLKLFYPIVWFVNLFVSGLLRLFHLRSSSDPHAQRLSQEELRSMVLEGNHFIPPKHQSILVNLFDLEHITVDDIMIPRTQIEAIDIESEPDVLRQQLSTSYHTRLPIFKGHLDEIIGIIHIRKVLGLSLNTELDGESLRQILREPYFIPSGTLLLTQLQHFQENQRRIGLVVDEYGELMGLVTLEDILEEIIGEFTTQAPGSGGQYRRQPDGSFLVEGTSLLRNLNRKLGTAFPLNGPKTLNGLILEHFEDIPEAGTSLKIGDHALEILQTQDRAVKIVRISADNRQ